MRFSRQREAILSFLGSRRDHPTAELIYSNVRETFPNISLGTVYRNLNQLAEAGIISKYSFGGVGMDHFDPDTTPHQHFVCMHCNSVLDLPMEDAALSSIDKAASMGFDGSILGHRLYFYGICRDCLDKESG